MFTFYRDVAISRRLVKNEIKTSWLNLGNPVTYVEEYDANHENFFD